MAGATINGKDLKKDWGIIIQKRVIHPPEVETRLVDVPGGGFLDFTEVFGRVNYVRRDIDLSLGAVNSRDKWREYISRFLNEYHGQKVKIVFNDDNTYYYIGRFYMESDVERIARIGTFSAVLEAEAYKYETRASTEPWLWDTFNFHTGYIKNVSNISITPTNNKIKIPAGCATVVPIFQVASITGSLAVNFGGKSYPLRVGDNRFPQIRIGKEELYLTFTGTGTVSVYYRGVSL